jgi:hypothetical protein
MSVPARAGYLSSQAAMITASARRSPTATAMSMLDA